MVDDTLRTFLARFSIAAEQETQLGNFDARAASRLKIRQAAGEDEIESDKGHKNGGGGSSTLMSRQTQVQSVGLTMQRR